MGVALLGDADAGTIRSAAQEVLGNPSFRDEAVNRSAAFGEVDGAPLAADSLEQLLARST